jgi:glycosyltransferase involved in cell wall biosynthesis
LLKRLNILQLINIRWYNACAYYAISLSHALKKRGHRVIVAGDPGSPPLAKADTLGLETYQDLFLSSTSPWMVAYNAKRMSDMVKQEGIDIINAHRGEGHLTAALARVLFKRKVPLIRTRGDVRPPKSNPFTHYLNHKLTDKVITTCEVLRTSYLNSLKMPEEKVINVPVGIDHDLFGTKSNRVMWRERLNIPEGSPVVGILGRLSPVKGHKYFIQAAEYVLKENPQTIFIICGENAQISAGELKKTVMKMNQEENFRFLGRIEEVGELISIFDVAAVSSVGSETICRVALEYMCLGKPVVGTRVNAIPEVVEHEVNGLVVEPKKSKEFADALLELLQDENKRRKFGENGRNMVLEKFNLDSFARKTEEVYFSSLS